MTKHYRIIFEEYEPNTSLPRSKNILFEGQVSRPKDFMDFGLSHQEQISVISKTQDMVLKLQAGEITSTRSSCPKCKEGSLNKHGFQSSWFHDVFSDHHVKIPRRRCNKCGHVESASVHHLLGNSLSGELLKIQSEIGSNHSYRDSERLIEIFCHGKRSINNHETIRTTSEQVGASLSNLNQVEEDVLATDNAEELVIHVDGGHINSKEKGERSFEAMTATVYRPDSLISNKTNTRNYIASKNCAASALFDSQEQMKKRTLIASLKQGLNPETKITALCDGAQNCWNVVDALEPFCSSIEKILDWFHITMKLKNISLPEPLKEKL
jgi:ribosomal protein S27AE